MKANRNFSADREASAAVVFMFLILAAVAIFAIFVAYQGGVESPSGSITNFEPDSDNANDNVVLHLLSGHDFPQGEWKVSVTSGRFSNPVYALGNSTFHPGEQITFNTTTVATIEAHVDRVYEGGTPIVAGDYRVVVFDVPGSSVLSDDVVTVD